ATTPKPKTPPSPLPAPRLPSSICCRLPLRPAPKSSNSSNPKSSSLTHVCSSRSPRSNPQDAQRVYPAPEKSARSLSFLADFLIPTCAGNIFVTSSLLSFCEGALTNVSSDILATALEFEIKGYGTLRGCRFHTKLSRFPDLYSSVMVIPLNF